jgi:DNA-binding transcriptional ArsR family regulator
MSTQLYSPIANDFQDDFPETYQTEQDDLATIIQFLSERINDAEQRDQTIAKAKSVSREERALWAYKVRERRQHEEQAGIIQLRQPEPEPVATRKPVRRPKHTSELLTDDKAPSVSFAQIPDKLVRDTSMPAEAFRLYCNLLLWSGKNETCWPGQDLLARQAGLSTRQIREHLKTLEDAGWITVRRRRNNSSIYRPQMRRKTAAPKQ